MLTIIQRWWTPGETMLNSAPDSGFGLDARISARLEVTGHWLNVVPGRYEDTSHSPQLVYVRSPLIASSILFSYSPILLVISHLVVLLLLQQIRPRDPLNPLHAVCQRCLLRKCRTPYHNRQPVWSEQ